MRTAYILSVVCVVTAFALLGMQSSNGQNVIAVELQRQKAPVDGQRPKLSPQLDAVKNLDATLKGVSSEGKLILGVADETIETVKMNAAVQSVTTKVPSGWIPAKRMKLSYGPGGRPSNAELEALSLKVVEDYAKGGFMEVELMTGEIDSKLLMKLSEKGEIRYVTLIQSLKSI